MWFKRRSTIRSIFVALSAALISSALSIKAVNRDLKVGEGASSEKSKMELLIEDKEALAIRRSIIEAHSELSEGRDPTKKIEAAKRLSDDFLRKTMHSGNREEKRDALALRRRVIQAQDRLIRFKEDLRKRT